MLVRKSGVAPLECRVCGADGEGELVAEFPIWGREPGTAVRCPTCGSIDLVDDLLTFSPTEESVDSYVESSAGVSTILRFIADVDRPSARFLDVGCNVGFALDFARWRNGWDVVGVEPSVAGVRGARELGLDIRNEYFGPESELGAPFDVILCSEVIEHVPDPRAFARALCANLADDGVLILTTPDADVVANGSDDTAVLSAFSSGFHHYIPSAPALERVLHDAGFAIVRVWSVDGSSLRAVARRTPGPLPDPERRDTETFRLIDRYLHERGSLLPASSSMAMGLALRAFKDTAARGEWDLAPARLERLREVFLTRRGIDITDPDALAALPAAPDAAFGALPIICYALGMFELLARADAARAERYLGLVEYFTRGQGPEAFAPHLELVETVDLARYHRLLARARMGGEAIASGVEVPPAFAGTAEASQRLTAIRRLRLLVEAAVHGNAADAESLLRPLSEVASAALSDDTEWRKAGRDALYASAAVLVQTPRLSEAEAFIAFGREVLTESGDENLLALLEDAASRLPATDSGAAP